MITIRRSKTLPTEAHATRFLYTILKQLDLKSIDWSLVATELDISNGHAARMRYSRFKQQMEGSATTTTAASKTTKPKKVNGKTDLGKSNKQSAKRKNSYDKSKNFDDGKCSNSRFAAESGFKKRPVPDDFMKHQDNSKMFGYGVMSSEQMNNFAPVMFDPFANAASYWTPSAGTILSTDASTFPYMLSMQDSQQHKQQQQQQYPVDPFANMYLGPMQQMQTREDMSVSLNQGWSQQGYDPSFCNDQFNQKGCANVANQLEANKIEAPAATAINTANPTEWNNQMDFCFSGCCRQPYPYPSTPSLCPDTSNSSQSVDSLMSVPPSEPWIPPPPQNQWVPIKPEPGEEGNMDDIFVKVESDS